jgi:hypothetical protein
MAQSKKESTGGPAQLPPSVRQRLDRPSLWGAMVGMLAVGVFHLFLPPGLLITPAWLLLAVEAVFLLPMAFSLLSRHGLPYTSLHILLHLLLGVLTLVLVCDIALLLITVIGNKYATVLLRAALLLWCSQVLVFGLWYWRIDGGGPVKRQQEHSPGAGDFLFPQQENGNPTGWMPCFLDYLFVAFTGATALSPTEMFPLTARAKALLMIEALLSLLVVAVPAVSQFHLPW